MMSCCGFVDRSCIGDQQIRRRALASQLSTDAVKDCEMWSKYQNIDTIFTVKKVILKNNAFHCLFLLHLDY